MKYFIGASMIALALAGCNSSPTQIAMPVENVPNIPTETQVINFVGPMDLTNLSST